MNQRGQNMQRIKKLIIKEEFIEAFKQLQQFPLPINDFIVQQKCARLFSKIPKESLGLKPIKIGIVGTSTMEHFANVFYFWMAKEGFDVTLYLTEFNTLDQSILNPESKLYEFCPDIVWFFTNYRDVRMDIPFGCPAEVLDEYIQEAVSRYVSLWCALQRYSSAFIIQNNADMPLTRIFGNYEGSVSWGRSNLMRLFNLKLSQSIVPGVAVFDLDYISSLYGKRLWFESKYWYHSKHSFALDAVGLVAFRGARLVSAIKGQSKKCIVVDLDNTLWGGVIGDDGLEGIRLGHGADGEAFVDFQKYLLDLKNRGIILAVCSKNEEETAKLPFLKHPDTQIVLDDIAVFVANWDNKADNIREIAAVLNIGLDSIVFIDDNPVERALVRNMLPSVSVPELSSDPVRYIQDVEEHCFFETISYSIEDQSRSEMYRVDVQRKELQHKCTDISTFLQGLSMEAVVGECDQMNLSRISQLINKSNQFHLTTTRYTETQLTVMMKDSNVICRYFKLKDCFGDNGLISVIILRKANPLDLVVDTWVMSCRVFARGMEDFVHNEIVSIAKTLCCSRIIGRYVATKKNAVVRDLYSKLGYALIKSDNGETESEWVYRIHDVLDYKTTFIKKEEVF